MIRERSVPNSAGVGTTPLTAVDVTGPFLSQMCNQAASKVPAL